MEIFRWLHDVFSNRRTPHWTTLAFLAIGIGVATFYSLATLNFSFSRPIILSINSGDTIASSAACAIFISISIFLISLMIFNQRAVNLKYSIIPHEGELKYEDEIHIALRIPTLKNIIKSLSDRLDKEISPSLLNEAGFSAGSDFGEKFPTIYYENRTSTSPFSPLTNRLRWRQLSNQEKLDAWTDYDKGAGWGRLMVVYQTNGHVIAQVFHKTMFVGPGGDLLAHFLSGYIAGVCTKILGSRFRLIAPPDSSGAAIDHITLQFEI